MAPDPPRNVADQREAHSISPRHYAPVSSRHQRFPSTPERPSFTVANKPQRHSNHPIEGWHHPVFIPSTYFTTPGHRLPQQPSSASTFPSTRPRRSQPTQLHTSASTSHFFRAPGPPTFSPSCCLNPEFVPKGHRTPHRARGKRRRDLRTRSHSTQFGSVSTRSSDYDMAAGFQRMSGDARRFQSSSGLNRSENRAPMSNVLCRNGPQCRKFQEGYCDLPSSSHEASSPNDRDM